MKKMKVILWLIILTMITFCTRPQSPKGRTNPETEPEPEEKEKVITLFHPLSSEGMNGLSQSEIDSRFLTVLKIIFPKDSKKRLTKMPKGEFTSYVYKLISEDPVVKEINKEFEANGVYIMVGSINGEEKGLTRYKDDDHYFLYQNGFLKIIELFMYNSGIEESQIADELKKTLGSDRFAFDVAKEDHRDIVFRIDKADLELNTYLLPDSYVKDYQDELVTITHFWDPDKGWNAGNTNLFKLLKEVVQALIGEYNSVEKLLEQLRPEYVAALLKKPPSAYYKALCLWYGWRWIEWKQKDDVWDNLGLSDGHIFMNKETLHDGIVQLIAKGNRSLATTYLAHVVHLLQDMTVPAHVHNWPHGKELGGDDFWEKRVLKRIRDILFCESYRFNLEESGGTYSINNGSFIYYASKNPTYEKINEDMNDKIGSLFYQVKVYYDKFGNTFGLWPLFFNTAQATQFFPLYTSWSKIIQGNGVPSRDSASYILDSLPEFSATRYSYYNQGFDQNYINNCFYEGALLGPEKTKPTNNSADYYIVYNNTNFDGIAWSEDDGHQTEKKIKFTLSDLLWELQNAGVIEITYDENKTLEENIIQLIEVDGNSVRVKKLAAYIDNPLIVTSGRQYEVDGVMQNLEIILIDDSGYINGAIKIGTGNYMGSLNLHYIGFPFNKMYQYLIPLTLATTARLIRNYHRYY